MAVVTKRIIDVEFPASGVLSHFYYLFLVRKKFKKCCGVATDLH